MCGEFVAPAFGEALNPWLRVCLNHLCAWAVNGPSVQPPDNKGQLDCATVAPAGREPRALSQIYRCDLQGETVRLLWLVLRFVT